MSKLKTVTAKTPEALAQALGLSQADAREWRVQHTLTKRLQDAVKKEGVTHAELAQRAGTSRSRVTAILNDNLEQVSTDLLIRLLAALDYDVRVTVSKARRAA
jgi:transcriptional regulator with XRE-family HTH domain